MLFAVGCSRQAQAAVQAERVGERVGAGQVEEPVAVENTMATECRQENPPTANAVRRHVAAPASVLPAAFVVLSYTMGASGQRR